MRPSLARKCRKAAQDRQKNEMLAYATQSTEVPIRQGGKR
jgi:hypothetical protein